MAPAVAVESKARLWARRQVSYRDIHTDRRPHRPAATPTGGRAREGVARSLETRDRPLRAVSKVDVEPGIYGRPPRIVAPRSGVIGGLLAGEPGSKLAAPWTDPHVVDRRAIVLTSPHANPTVLPELKLAPQPSPVFTDKQRVATARRIF
ncbi:hypothetical protein [Rhodovibrio sodomensis]|uniref:hypothetical protein n=1 Tax=Rhodovibrio sodomensis TaxID=1088 RepID=UPI001905CA65|nr:hypothetical protein [Rhodovibrio sodomensis]